MPIEYDGQNLHELLDFRDEWTMNQKPRFACPCCGYLTLSEEPPGTYEVCPVCDWGDDDAQVTVQVRC